MWSLIVLCVLVVDVVLSSTKLKFSKSLSITNDDYTAIDIDVGTPTQTLNVLLDSINTETFVMTNNTKDLSAKQDYFISSKSTTYSTSTPPTTFTYNYENASTNGTEGSDIIQIGGMNISSVTFGLSDYNQDLFEEEKLGGALSISRSSEYISKFKSSSVVTNHKVLVDIDSQMIHFGDYHGNTKNDTQVDCYTANSDLSSYWTFSFDSMSAEKIPSLFTCDNQCYGVIDTASPYLTFSMSKSEYNSLFENIGGSGNCYQSTLKCDKTSDITEYISFTIGNNTFYMSRDDFYYNKRIHLQYKEEIVDGGMVVFFGKPFLQTLKVSLHATNDTITFSYNGSNNNNKDKWQTVWISAICVAVFAIIFFGIFFWKFKIPPPTRQNQNEEQENIALLQGQPIRAQPHQPLGQPAQAQPQPQPARETLEQEPAQAVGSSTGARSSNDPDEIRRRRLQFLESQQQQQADEE